MGPKIPAHTHKDPEMCNLELKPKADSGTKNFYWWVISIICVTWVWLLLFAGLSHSFILEKHDQKLPPNFLFLRHEFFKATCLQNFLTLSIYGVRKFWRHIVYNFHDTSNCNKNKWDWGQKRFQNLWPHHNVKTSRNLSECWLKFWTCEGLLQCSFFTTTTL